MRSFLLVILCCVVLVGAFVMYNFFQPPPNALKGKLLTSEAPPPPDPSSPGLDALKPGRGAWVLNFDEQTGQLKSRFRADEYIPQSNGIVKVTRPEAEFFMPNHQKMRLLGVTGEVVVPGAANGSKAPKGALEQGPTAPPSRGRIHTVTIELFNLLPDSKSDVPDEVIHTNNVQFDNETLLITTESFTDASGSIVAPDRVPVSMRSNAPTRGYDFDGWGLRLRWNDKDGRLELLEVAHGKQLVIKDASSVSGTFGPTRTKPSESGGEQRAVSPSASAWSGGSGWGRARTRLLSVPFPSPAYPAVEFAPSMVRAVALARPEPQGPHAHPPAAVRAKPRTRTAAPPTPYVATFFDNVTITQGQEVLVTGDRMDVDFTTRQNDQTPATRPAAVSSTRTSGAAHPESGAGNHAGPALGVAAAMAPATQRAQPASRPATQPVNQPVVIRWTGKLIMTPPLPGERPKVAPGDSVIELTGRPVNIRRTPAQQPQGDDIKAARVIYHTADGSVKLLHSDAFPEVVISKIVNGKIDPRSTITTGTLDYGVGAVGHRVAILTGPGHAMVPMESQNPQPGSGSAANRHAANSEIMDAHWQKGAKAYLRPGGRGQENLSIERVDLAGDVDVKHPQLAMNSQALSLYFEPAASSPATHPATQKAGETTAELRQVLAHDKVHCRLTDDKGKVQTIDCADLDLRTARTPEGKIFARNVNAKGQVHAFDGEQDLRAEIVDLTLKPTAPPPTRPAGPVNAPNALTGARGGSPVPENREAAEDHATAAPRLASASAPAQTQPAGERADTGGAELETMIARQHVRVTNKEGSLATGDELIVTTEGGEPHVRLSSATQAMVIDPKKNTVTGPLITMEPRRGNFHVIGQGTMHVIQEQAASTAHSATDAHSARELHSAPEVRSAPIAHSAPDVHSAPGTQRAAAEAPKPRPMDVSWTHRADMNGAENRIDIDGNVSLRAVDTDGTINTANGDTARIDLVKKPVAATRPSSQPVAHRPSPATRPARGDAVADSMQMDVMKDKDVKTVTISSADKASKVVSTLLGADGKVQRRFALLGPKIIYEVAGTPAHPGKSLLVPSAGQMLVSDHRPPEIKPAADKRAPRQGGATPAHRGAAPNARKDSNDESDSRGDTAFDWRDHLFYSESDHQALMVGSVKIIHQGEDTKEGKQEKVQILGDVVTATFASERTGQLLNQGRSAATAHAAAEPTAAMQLRHLDADGHASVTRAGAVLSANHLEYDPLTHWMKARGTDANPAHYEDPDPNRSLTARELQWNTQTWNIKASGASAANPR